jgi:exosome complex component RRP46
MPALFQTSVLALLSAGVPMKATATATTMALNHQDGSKRTIVDPSPREVETAQSVHVLAFTSHDELLFAESEGDFTVKEWDDVYETARKVCCRPAMQREGIAMVLDDEDASGPDMRHFIRSAMESKVATDLQWK